MKCDGETPACAGCKKYGRAASCSLGDAGSPKQRDYVTYLQASIQQLRSTLGKDTGPGGTASAQHRPSSRAGGEPGISPIEGMYAW